MDYYATFDNFGVGVIRELQIIEGLSKIRRVLSPNSLVAPDDTNAFYFYGATFISAPHRQANSSFSFRWAWILLVPCADGTGRPRMTTSALTTPMLSMQFFPRTMVYCGHLLPAALASGTAEPHPLSPPDAEVASVKAMIAGEQTYTVQRHPRTRCPDRQNGGSGFEGQTVDINDTKTYDKASRSFLPTC